MQKKKNNHVNQFSLSYGQQEGSDYRDTWQVFRIMAEFVSGYQFLSNFSKVVTIFGSARTSKNNKYYKDAVMLGKYLGKNKYVTITGGGPGIMEAANKGADLSGGESVGLNIQLPFEQRTNPYVKKSIAFNYFFTRKVMLSAPAHVYVFYPGGYGTMDEMFEILDSMELGLIDRVPIVLVGKEFWQPLLDFMKDNAVERVHCLEQRDLDMIQIVDNAKEAYAIIKKAPTQKQLCGYHSVDNFYCGDQINWRIFRIMSEIVTGFEFLTEMSHDITILGTKSVTQDSPYCQAAYALGGKLAAKKYTVVTGGGSGIMEAANKGAYEAGGESVGLYTHSIDQGKVNSYLTRSLAFDFSYTRKLILTSPSKAFVLFPGGFGTMDQCFEVLTLIQTEKMKHVPVILFGKEYWGPLLEFIENNVFEKKHAISKQDLKLLDVVDSVDEVMTIISRHRK